MLARCLFLAAAVAVPAPVWGDTVEPPFVAGFDRFGRPGDVDAHAGGRLLLGELNCTACHPDGTAARGGPRLDGAGLRLRPAWMKRFLAAPQAVKPGTTMPDVLHGLPADRRSRAADALAAFLAAQKAPFPVLKADARNPLPHEFWARGDPERGRTLYHRVGCVACHEPDKGYAAAPRAPSPLDGLLAELDPEEVKKLNLPRPARSVPLGDLAAKYTREALTHFLLDPETVRPGGRMPNPRLLPAEAADLTAYLLPGPAGDAGPEPGPALVNEGRQLFTDLRCVNCHALPGLQPRPAKRLDQFNLKAAVTCYGAPVAGQPHFPLDAVQTDAVRKALGEQRPQPTAEPVAFSLLKLNCYACHSRDGRGGVALDRRPYFETAGHLDMGDEGRLPPTLDGVGRKLTRAWLGKVLAGAGDVRPHMLAHMPKFPAAAVAALPEALARADGAKEPTERDVFGDTRGLEVVGRSLLDTAGCLQCHPLRGERMPGVAGVDLAGIPARTHPAWFHAFLLDPAALRPGTRMPTFFADGKSPLPNVLGGRADRQVAALWAYLKEIDRQPLPDKLAQGKAKEFEVIPRDRPVLLRTFMKEAGPLAIAVGFPAKVHLAFDAEQVRPALAWRGRFLDAHGTWFDRLAPPAAPLGTDVTVLPPGVPLALLPDGRGAWPAAEDAGYRFEGYRLDRGGVPTFLYRFGPLDVGDRLEPGPAGTLHRRLRLTRRTPEDGTVTVWFRAHAGRELRRAGPATCGEPAGLTVSVTEALAKRGTLTHANGGAEWRIPVEVGREVTIEVNYQW